MRYDYRRIAGLLLVLSLVAAIAVAGPLFGRSDPGPETPPAGNDPAPLAADPQGTTSSPTTTTDPVRFTTDTTMPTVVETVFGTMTIVETTVDIGGHEATMTNPVATPDGFAVMATTERGVELWSSTDGIEWAREPVPDIFGEYPWIGQLISSGDALLALGRGDQRPRAWLRAASGRWMDVDIYASTVFDQEDLRWHFLDALGSATKPGEFSVVGGAISYVDWSGLVDDVGHHGLDWDREARQLIAYTESGDRRFDLEVSGLPIGAFVVVRDAASGEMVHEADIFVPGLSPGETVAAMLESGGNRLSVANVTVHINADGSVEKSIGRELDVDAVTGFAANERHAVVMGMSWQWDEAPQEQVFAGPLDGPWVEVTPAFGLAEGSTIAFVAAREGQFLATGLTFGKTEISPSVFATGPVAGMWLSDDGSEWAELPRLIEPVAHDLVVVGGGELGWAASTDSCMVECTRYLWLSPDGLEWDQIILPDFVGRSISMQVSGVAVTADRVVTVAWMSVGEYDSYAKAVITVASVDG